MKTIDKKINDKGYNIRANMGYINDVQTIVNYSAMKDNKVIATAKSKTALYNSIK